MAGIDRITELSIRASSMEPRVDGTPVRGVGWLETAAAMGKLKPESADLLRALYLNDAGALRRVLSSLQVRLCRTRALSEGMRSAVAAASMQALIALRPCVACDGAGRHKIAETVELDDSGDWLVTPAVETVCESCEGEGLDHVDAAAIRELLGVGESVWNQLVGEPFRDCYRELRHRHDTAAAMMAGRLR